MTVRSISICYHMPMFPPIERPSDSRRRLATISKSSVSIPKWAVHRIRSKNCGSDISSLCKKIRGSFYQGLLANLSEYYPPVLILLKNNQELQLKGCIYRGKWNIYLYRIHYENLILLLTAVKVQVGNTILLRQ